MSQHEVFANGIVESTHGATDVLPPAADIFSLQDVLVEAPLMAKPGIPVEKPKKREVPEIPDPFPVRKPIEPIVIPAPDRKPVKEPVTVPAQPVPAR